MEVVTNTKCTNDEQNNDGSFSSSDVYFRKRSVIQTNTKMDVRAKCTNLKLSNFIATLTQLHLMGTRSII